MPFPPALLALYPLVRKFSQTDLWILINRKPQVFHLLSMFCCGEWKFPFSQAIVINDAITIHTEIVIVSVAAVILWFLALSPTRQYRFADGTNCRRWDPSHSVLTFSVLLSPLHLALLLYLSLRSSRGGNGEHGSSAPWLAGIFIATAHAYSSLLIVRSFLRSENIQKQIFSGVYAAEVSFREKQQNLRRQAERQIFERFGQ